MFVGGDFFEDVFDNRYSHPDTAFVVTASWGDSDRSFAPVVRERMVQEWSQELHRDERRLTDRVGRYYSERARLMAQEFADSVRDARTVQIRAHRIHELTSHLAHLTGGLIQPPP